MNDIQFKLPLNGGNATRGERRIEEVLQKVTQNLNTFYNREVKIGYFAGKRRRADFAFNYQGKTFLIEFDGIQHSRPIEQLGGIAGYKETKARDRWENLTYCPQNNICLIRYKVFRDEQGKLLNFITPERVMEDIKKAINCKYVQNGISYGRKRLKIASDLDDCCFDFINPFNEKFKCNISNLPQPIISDYVLQLRLDRDFWSNLPLLEKPDFTPELYCTKRINSKAYTRACLRKHHLPIRPISQITSQQGNKARYIKNKCDVLIDDSWFNVQQCLSVGFPALLITREHNKHINTPYRVNHLKYQEIAKKYYELF